VPIGRDGADDRQEAVGKLRLELPQAR
jgi:hypothetical protein